MDFIREFLHAFGMIWIFVGLCIGLGVMGLILALMCNISIVLTLMTTTAISMVLAKKIVDRYNS